MSYEIKPLVKVFWYIARPIVKVWMHFQMHPKIEDRLPKGLNPPYLVISNHVNVYDGLLVTIYLKHLPVTVFDDVQRINPMNRFIFTNAGVVFKPYGVPDPLVVRNMIKARDHGRAILLYPEGEITWTGDSKPLELNFARLLKTLGIPVILAKFKGGFAKQPRWSGIFRSGSCSIDLSLLLSKEDIESREAGELLKLLQAAHGHKELDWLTTPEGRKHNYYSSEPAEGLESMLFCCPNCQGFNTMVRKGADAISCHECQYSVSIDAYLGIKANSGKLIQSDIRSWFNWEKSHWAQETVRKALKNEAIISDFGASIKAANLKNMKAQVVGNGPVVLFGDRVEFESQAGRSFIMMDKIRVCHCYRFAPGQETRLLLRTEDTYYILKTAKPNPSAKSWEIAINALMEAKLGS